MREGWREVRLRDVCRVIVDRLDPTAAGQGVPYVGLEHISPVTAQVAQPGLAAGVTSQVTRFLAGDTLFGRLRPYLRKVALAHFEGVCSPEILVLRPESRVVDPGFLYLLASSESVVARAIATSAGSRMPRTSAADLGAFGVLLPPLVEQRRIVDLVAAVDRARFQSQVAAAYEAAADALMGEVTATASDWTTLASVVSRARAGGTPSRREAAFFGGPIPWLKSGEVDADWIDRASESLTEQGLANSSAWVMPSGSIVVAMYGQGLTAGSVGYTAVSMAANQAVLGLVPDPRRVDPRFLFHWLCSRKESLRHRRSGSSQPNLNKETVIQEPVPIVALDRQRIVAGVLDSLTETGSESERVADALGRVRTALVADLLSGDHEIPASYDRFLDGAA